MAEYRHNPIYIMTERKTYNDKELKILSTAVDPYYRRLIEDFVTRYTMEDIVYGDAFKKTSLMSDLLIQESMNAIAFSQVGGLGVMDCTHHVIYSLSNRFTMLQLDAAFIQR